MNDKPYIHGRDHRARWNPETDSWAGGADPIPTDVFLSASPYMGQVLGRHRIIETGFGLNGGLLYLPSREGAPLETGERVEIALSHADPDAPDSAHLEWLAARLHVVSGLRADWYHHTEPWNSRPWAGSSSSAGTGASLTLTPIGGNWNGSFYGFAGVSDTEGDVVHFSTPGLAVDDDEQFGWDLAGVGHIGYMFHDFTTSEAGSLTVAFASGAGGEKRGGYVRCERTGAVTVGATVGEEETDTTVRVNVELTDDLAAGDQIIVVTGSKGQPGYYPSDANARPAVESWSRRPESPLVPMFKYGTQLLPVVSYIGGLGHGGGDIDGGGA